MAFALQINQNRGLQYFAPLRSHLPLLLQSLLMLFPRSGPTLFWLISPEAVLLTGKENMLDPHKTLSLESGRDVGCKTTERVKI
jgi:hypothetical protein